MNRFSAYALCCLLGVQIVPLHAVKPETPREVALHTLAMVPIIAPLEFACLEHLFGQTSFSQTIQNPKLWGVCAIGSVVAAALLYYVFQKYTPESKFAWVVNVKKEVEADEIVASRTENNAALHDIILHTFYDYPFLNAVHRLYSNCIRLESVCAYVLEAPQDVPDDVAFAATCERTAQEIKNLIKQIEQHAGRIIRSKQWCEDLLGEDLKYLKLGMLLLPKYLFPSLEWSGKLERVLIPVPGQVGIPMNFVLDEGYLSRMVDLSEHELN